MPATMTLSQNGTLTLAPELIEHIGAKAGDTLLVEKLPAHGLKLEPQKKPRDLMDFAGCFKSDLHFTIDELEEATIQGFLEAEKAKGLI